MLGHIIFEVHKKLETGHTNITSVYLLKAKVYFHFANSCYLACGTLIVSQF